MFPRIKFSEEEKTLEYLKKFYEEKLTDNRTLAVMPCTFSLAERPYEVATDPVAMY